MNTRVQYNSSEDATIIRLIQHSYPVRRKNKIHAQWEDKKRIDTLYQRYNDGLINSSKLLTGLSYLVGNKI